MDIEWTRNVGCGASPAQQVMITAAVYVRMSTDHQRYSTDNQIDAIRRYAEQHKLKIVRTYADEGKSGLSLAGRDALQALLQDVENDLADYRILLVYDVSRLGRFQDPDEAAEIELRCKRRGIHVHYCAEPFNNDGSLGSSILKTVKRAMAGEYSRELSAKVFAGHVNLTRLGFHQGGPAGYGLRRLLIDQAGNPKSELRRGEHKSIATDRIVLVPGPPDEIAVVQEVYRLFTRERLNEIAIAEVLNRRGLVTDLGRPWTRAAVRQILINEKYVGNNVWGRTSFKLRQTRVRQPAASWIRAAGAFEAIVDIKTFEKARSTIAARTARLSDATMLQKLSAVFEQNGYLCRRLVDEAEDCPSSCRYATRFGSLRRAYALVGFVHDRDFQYLEINAALRRLLPEVYAELVRGVEAAGGSVSQDPNTDMLTINHEITASVLVLRCMHTRAGNPRWKVRLDKIIKPDLFVLVRMGPDNDAPYDYYVLPSADIASAGLRLCEANDLSLDAYRCESLDRFFAMGARSSLLEVT